MSIANQLMTHIEHLQETADRKSGYELYPENQCLLPNDAIWGLRYSNAKIVFELIEKLVKESGKDLETVLKKSIEPNISKINESYPHTSEILQVVIRDFGGAT